MGLIIAVTVTAASTTDNAICLELSDKVVEHTTAVTTAYVDAGFKDDVMIHGVVHGIAVEQVKRNNTASAFVPLAHPVGGRAHERHADATTDSVIHAHA